MLLEFAGQQYIYAVSLTSQTPPITVKIALSMWNSPMTLGRFLCPGGMHYHKVMLHTASS